MSNPASRHLIPWVALTGVLGVLAGCSGVKVGPNPVNPAAIPDPSDYSTRGSLTGDEGLLGMFGKDKKSDSQGTGIGVNAFLWRGALDTLGFMPLTSADPFGGVIITDWYTPPATSDERFKMTAYILTKDLRSDGVRINIFRQVMQNGQWVDAPVSNQTVGDIENKVLAKARKLREETLAKS